MRHVPRTWFKVSQKMSGGRFGAPAILLIATGAEGAGTVDSDLYRPYDALFFASLGLPALPPLWQLWAAAASRRPARALTATRRAPTRQALGPASRASHARVRSAWEGCSWSVWLQQLGSSREAKRAGWAKFLSIPFFAPISSGMLPRVLRNLSGRDLSTGSLSTGRNASSVAVWAWHGERARRAIRWGCRAR